MRPFRPRPTPRSSRCAALGHEVAFLWSLSIDFGEGNGGMRIEIISVMTFDDEGKIASMKAYWGPENVTQL